MHPIATSRSTRSCLLSALIALAACGNQTTPPSAAAPSTVSTEAANAAQPNASAAKKITVATDAPTAVASPSTQPPDQGDAAFHVSLIEVDRPPFGYALKQSVNVDVGQVPKITKASQKKNDITDTADWFEKNGLQFAGPKPSMGPTPLPKPPEGAPAELGSNKLHVILEHGDHAVLLYGSAWNKIREVIVLDKSGKARAQYDFSSFVKPPEVVPGQEAYTYAQVSWAIEKDGILYVSTAHDSYAKNSKGKNAFVTAIDAKTGNLQWQSEPLVCNARNFVIHGAYIICGYGYTSEPDFLYVLSRADGKTVSKIPLGSGPSYLVMKSDKLHVRTYDTDYVFKVE